MLYTEAQMQEHVEEILGLLYQIALRDSRIPAVLPQREFSEEAGLADIRTLVKLEGDSIRIRRYGRDEDDDGMDMTLKPGTLNVTRYRVPAMPSMDLEIYTHSLDERLDEEGYGTISVDYRIKFDRFFSRRNVLEIEVMPS